MGATLETSAGREEQVVIKLRYKAVVIGPTITLADVSKIMIQNRALIKKIGHIKIGMAPPPGESREISVSDIKKSLIKAGYEQYVNHLKGPRAIHITTAHNEIDKAFLREDYVSTRKTSSFRHV